MKVKVKVKVKVKQMVRNQGCKACRHKFKEDSQERNYDLYEKFGFKNRRNFEKHSSRNKRCPCKLLINTNTNANTNTTDISNLPLTKWLKYEKAYKYHKNMKTIEKYRDIAKSKYDIHTDEDGRELWFDETKNAVFDIIEGVYSKDIQWISLVAEPGAGKTMVAHYLIWYLTTLWGNEDTYFHHDNITVTTGMSDKSWYEGVLNNFTLQDGRYLWDSLSKRNNNHCLVHRSNFNKRINWLLRNKKFIANHVFIIDESHFADKEDQTIDNEFRRLGLTEQRMKEYNITVILISATPDVNISIMDRNDRHKRVQLQIGPNYKGFNFFFVNGYIIDHENINLENKILSTYTSPRFHFIRATTNQEKGEYRSSIINMCNENKWDCIQDDSCNPCYISVDRDQKEREKERENFKIIRTYEEPLVHTIILLKEKYRASKRLCLTEYTGLISEKPSKVMNTTVTCQGLVPRFFGYRPIPKFKNNENPVFICNLNCVKEYINFIKTWKYKGENGQFIDYSGTLIKSKKNKKIEKKNTTYAKTGNQENRTEVFCKEQDKPQEYLIIRKKTFNEIIALFESNDKVKQLGRGPNYRNKDERGFYRVRTQRDKTEEVRSKQFFKNIERTNSWAFKGTTEESQNKNRYRVYPCYENLEDSSTLEWWLVYYEL